MKYAIGLDIGIESVGYAVLEVDSHDQPFRIERLGSRIFDRAEHPKDGSSLAAPRREARSARRRLRRHRHRLERIRGLIVSSGILSNEQLETLYDGEMSDIYELRTKALDELVSPAEFARILIHLAQRRGFQSNRKAVDEADKEGGQLLKAISANKELCEAKSYRTVGEMMYRDEKFSECKRNKAENYQNTVDRASVEAEARMIFECQRSYGASYASEQIEEAYVSILVRQRSFADGPACGPYSGNQVERMRGCCTFESGEFRAAKATYSFQLFNLWQHINHIRILRDGVSTALTDEERWSIYHLAHEKAEITYAQLRKHLDLGENDDFVGISYKDGERDKTEKSRKIKDLSVYHDIRKCLAKASPGVFEALSHDQLDAIGEALSKNQSDEGITAELQMADIPAVGIETLLKLPNYSKNGHLSIKACKKIIPHLELGLTYDKACVEAGYQKMEQTAQMYLPPVPQDDSSITSPVVRRAVSQTIKVINAIIREMGASPVYINIELARELAHDKKERDKIKKAQDDNAARNEKAMNQLREYVGGMPSGQDLIKYKLWEEQQGRCMYSDEPIQLERLTEPGYVDVDHIVPYSICFDDRMANKVLVLARENRQKGNRLPLQYLSGQRRDDFIVRVRNMHIASAKKNRLLKESISDEEDWKQRNLQDTQHMAAFLHQYISDHLLFAPSGVGRKRRVVTVNGAITAYMRKRWWISKIRENGDLHHAVDAVVIACVTQGMINRISKYSYYKETKDNGDFVVDAETGEVIDRFPMPWPHFRDELDIRLTQDVRKLRKQLFDVNYDSYAEIDLDTVEPPFVSRMSNHKVTGAAHKETVRSGKMADRGKTISKVPLTSLKLDSEGEIENYYNPDSDRLLYDALRERLAAFGGKGEKAFAEGEFHKPKADGTLGPVVKKVKVVSVASSMVEVQDHTGVADNDAMVRCDVFYVEGDGYYFVPIYVADTVKDELPSMAPIAGKDKETGLKKWKEMDNDDFVFSLYPNDLICIYAKKPITVNIIREAASLPNEMTVPGEDGLFLYYKGMDISRGALEAITHDNTYKHRSIGKTMLRIEKYEVDVLGNVRKVGREKRQSFDKRKK